MSLSQAPSQALHSFLTSYLLSAQSVILYIHRKLTEKASISVHAALRSLNQIVADVEHAGMNVALAASDGLITDVSTTSYSKAWITSVRSLASSASSKQTPDSKLSSQILLVISEIETLKILQNNLINQWTGNDSVDGNCAGYRPSDLLNGMSNLDSLSAIDGADYGLPEQTNNNDLSVFEGDNADDEMWQDLNSLTVAEEGLLLKWKGVIAKESRREEKKNEYRPQKAKGDNPKNFFAQKDRELGHNNSNSNNNGIQIPAAMRYHPREDEIISNNRVNDGDSDGDGTNNNDNDESKVKSKSKSNILEQMQHSHENKLKQDGLPENCDLSFDETDPELINLTLLQKFRNKNRAALIEIAPDTKYAHLKTVNYLGGLLDDVNGETDENNNNTNKNGMGNFMSEFDKTDESSKKNKGGKNMRSLENDTVGKFPFRLNRYTIDQKTSRPVRLWKGGDSLTDNPPLVSGPDEAKEVSTVSLVVPTQFLSRGGGGGGGGVNRLLKRAPSTFSLKRTVMINEDSPNLLQVCGAGGEGGGVKKTSGQQRDTVHEADPKDCSEVDIRRYKNNWGNYLGIDL